MSARPDRVRCGIAERPRRTAAGPCRPIEPCARPERPSGQIHGQGRLARSTLPGKHSNRLHDLHSFPQTVRPVSPAKRFPKDVTVMAEGMNRTSTCGLFDGGANLVASRWRIGEKRRLIEGSDGPGVAALAVEGQQGGQVGPQALDFLSWPGGGVPFARPTGRGRWPADRWRASAGRSGRSAGRRSAGPRWPAARWTARARRASTGPGSTRSAPPCPGAGPSRPSARPRRCPERSGDRPECTGRPS
jgi:hypothetical protein